MPAKRRTSKLRDQRITPEAVEAFRIGEAHKQIYYDCVSGKACRSEQPGRRHCAECRVYLDTTNLLDRLLGLKPWEPSPLNAEGDCPWSDGSGYAMSWDKVCELRTALIEHRPDFEPKD